MLVGFRSWSSEVRLQAPDGGFGMSGSGFCSRSLAVPFWVLMAAFSDSSALCIECEESGSLIVMIYFGSNKSEMLCK